MIRKPSGFVKLNVVVSYQLSVISKGFGWIGASG